MNKLTAILIIATIFFTACAPAVSDNNQLDKGDTTMKEKETINQETNTNSDDYNHLQNESSPYLQQHATNPVNWYPYSDLAFARAKDENKLIFLSIGYSTCHWCHVMKRESFEDQEVADLLNKNYIAIKVDREERPDIDSYYMDLYQNISGNGGWPLTIILTPDQEMFYGATYLPKNSFSNRPGLIDTLDSLQTIWIDEPEKINKTASNISNLADELNQSHASVDFDSQLMKAALNTFETSFDEINGGFSSSPKFPSPHYVDFLLTNGDPFQVSMALKTLDAILLGGIQDQLAGGFHRYTVDAEWKIPHFEKMLYDQAGLISALTKAYKTTGNAAYKTGIESTISFVNESMSHEGLFYSAIDAESENVEGKYYVWDIDEIASLLSNDEIRVLGPYYSLEDEGNYLDETTMALNGSNILYRDAETFINGLALSMEEEALLKKGKSKLLEVRSQRVPPHVDEKILTDWNAYYIGSLLDASIALKDESIGKIAIESLKKLDSNMYKNINNTGNLYHNILDNKLGQKGFLDDYAYLLQAYMKAYERTYDIEYIQKSMALADITIERFWDENYKTFMFSEDKEAVTYKKKYIDSAYPSGFSILIRNLSKLSLLTGETHYETLAQDAAKSIASHLNGAPFVSLSTVEYVSNSSNNAYEIIIVQGENDDQTPVFLDVISGYNIANSVTIIKTKDNSSQLETLVPYTSNYSTLNNKTTVYICENTTCKLPVFDLTSLNTLLKSMTE